MNDILPPLSGIATLPSGGYVLAPACRDSFERYLRRYGFTLAELQTKAELVSALRFCNSAEFAKLVTKPAPAPAPALQFLWRRLRALGTPKADN